MRPLAHITLHSGLIWPCPMDNPRMPPERGSQPEHCTMGRSPSHMRQASFREFGYRLLPATIIMEEHYQISMQYAQTASTRALPRDSISPTGFGALRLPRAELRR